MLGSFKASTQVENKCAKRPMTYPDSILKSKDITLLINIHIAKAMVSPVVMYGYKNWTRGIGMRNTCKPMAVSFQCMTKSTTKKKKKELDHKDSWEPKNWCFQIVVLEKTLESPLNCKKIKPVSPKGNQSYIFTEGLKLKLQYFDPLMWWADSLEKTPDAGKEWRQKEKRVAEDEMVR